MQSGNIKIEQEDDQDDWNVVNDGRIIRDETSDDTERQCPVEDIE